MNRAVAKVFQSFAFYTAMEQAVHKCVLELQTFDAVLTQMIDAPASTVNVSKFFKQEVESSFLEKNEVEERFVKLGEAVHEKALKKRVSPDEEHGPGSISELSTDVLQHKKTPSRKYSTSASLDESKICRCQCCCRERRGSRRCTRR